MGMTFSSWQVLASCHLKLVQLSPAFRRLVMPCPTGLKGRLGPKKENIYRAFLKLRNTGQSSAKLPADLVISIVKAHCTQEEWAKIKDGQTMRLEPSAKEQARRERWPKSRAKRRRKAGENGEGEDGAEDSVQEKWIDVIEIPDESLQEKWVDIIEIDEIDTDSEQDIP